MRGLFYCLNSLGILVCYYIEPLQTFVTGGCNFIIDKIAVLTLSSPIILQKLF